MLWRIVLAMLMRHMLLEIRGYPLKLSVAKYILIFLDFDNCGGYFGWEI
jgi:hypothetical protein